ncbi:MAG: XcyI family restriction endonuclease [Ktedonobacteraceae bacterium]|nr:XcyI family restriction endonuclease [Ktedonobacteraceae bacterium]
MSTRKPDALHRSRNLLEALYEDTLFDSPEDVLLDEPVLPSDEISLNTPLETSQVISSTQERKKLYEKFEKRISTNRALDRALVSNQVNKKLPINRWFRYKESFSEPLIQYLIHHVLKRHRAGTLLDPFAGVGSALFAARIEGWKASGIELLPVGIYATQARLAAERVDLDEFRAAIAEILQLDFLEYETQDYQLKHITITRGAFPPHEERQLTGYIAYCKQFITKSDIQLLLLFAAFCVLEEMSYTRKDGQFLRWDVRSGRSWGAIPFNKGKIATFREAIEEKLQQMITDLEERYVQPALFDEAKPGVLGPEPELRQGSCLEVLPQLESSSVDAVITSPPYANRYDYTRTYALELVFLGLDEEQVKQLRQDMLSCTVENKDKRDRLQSFYTFLGREIDFEIIDTAFSRQAALQEVLHILDEYQAQGKLNNAGVVTLVRNYFYEMCFVIYELARILKPGGTIVMVNDNVRYAGEEVPVDLILSDIAETFGLGVKHIWTLSRGKGNSSQQMGSHGRSELRKCVYVWEKDATMAKARDQLLLEAHQINYRLRSTFFYRKIKEYNVLTFPSLVANLFPAEDLYNWDDRANWGIGDDAFAYIRNHHELKPIQVFCHPRLLREYPALLAYYRNIAALSQKAVGYLTNIDVKRYENDPDNGMTLTSQQILTLIRLFNEHISLIIDSSLQNFRGEELYALLLTSTGSQIDGAWRNAIGEEAEKVVQRLLLKEAVKRNMLIAFIPRTGTAIEPYDPAKLEEQSGNVAQYRGIMLSNQTSILFSSEPDISLIDRQGMPAGVIEVKGGTDPAGALERYGAAKKSFEKALKENPDARTILVASCITSEAWERISNDKTITSSFNLTEVIKEKKKYNEFVDLVFSVLEV